MWHGVAKHLREHQDTAAQPQHHIPDMKMVPDVKLVPVLDEVRQSRHLLAPAVDGRIFVLYGLGEACY